MRFAATTLAVLGLVVGPFGVTRLEAARQLPEPTDEQIRDAVEAALELGSTASIEIAVVDGVVALAGTARSDAERAAALRESRDVAGVRAVVDEMRVSAPGAVVAPSSQNTMWPMRPLLAKGSLQ